MVVWTGDNSPHDHHIGDQAIYEAAYCINVTAQMMQLAFAEQVNTTFGIYGNHDIFPHWDFGHLEKGNAAANQYAHWWKAWIDDPQVYERFRLTGYYSKQLNLVTDKIVKVIVLNTEACDIDNHFVYGQLKDPMG